MENLRNLLVFLLVFFLGLNLVPYAMAQDHLVSEAVLRNTLRDAAREREKNAETIGEFLSSPQVGKALGRFDFLDLERIAEAVPALSDQELAILADQIVDLDKDVKAGALSNEHLTYIVIALAAAVIVLIAVR
jgi:hypothetical protein